MRGASGRARPRAWRAVSVVLLSAAGACAADPGTPGDLGAPSQAAADCDFAAFWAEEARRVTGLADGYLSAVPRTVTADRAERSEGGPHDFYSEGDYWWPVPGRPDAPYEQRDGQTNPDNFVAHRLSMMRLADIAGAHAAAWQATGERRYADAALAHLRAWFVTPETRMNPTLLYAQAIKGRHTGRSIGIIDTLHLIDVARAADVLIEGGAVPAADADAIEAWFAAYATWMNSHPYGIEERDWHNNHSIAWSLQIASFAAVTGDEALMDLVREKFTTVYLPDHMNDEGGFPNELGRTKPYGYSLFVIDLMAGIAQLASAPGEDLWQAEGPAGHSLRDGIGFIAPYIGDKASWPYGEDIQYWEDWPVRQPALVFAAHAYGRCDYLEIASGLPASSDVYEVRRNVPIRYPGLWGVGPGQGPG